MSAAGADVAAKPKKARRHFPVQLLEGMRPFEKKRFPWRSSPASRWRASPSRR
jgi:hypothetical protein